MSRYEFLCGNAFKSLCKYSVGHYSSAREHHFSFNIRNDVENNYIFCKTEYIPTFFEYIKPEFDFVLFTHNSDVPIDCQFLKWLNNPRVLKWYGQNINIEHQKLHSIPIGLANPKWAHGNPEEFKSALASEPWKNKKNLLYANFDVLTNPQERQSCLKYTNATPPERMPFKDYLNDVAESYFVLSPNGNGIDCHKHWETFHMHAIPIVTQSANLKFYEDLPFLVLEDWSHFGELNLTPQLYHDIWTDFNPDELLFNNFVKKLKISS